MTEEQLLHSSLKRVIKYFILVLDALGDSEMRWLNAGASWDRAVGDAATAYGYTEAANVRLCPTSREVSQAEVVASWLSWLGMMEGNTAVPRLVKWAHDEPMWRLADREKVSVRTIANRIDRSIAAIMEQFGGGVLEINLVEEKQAKPVTAFAPRLNSVTTGIRDGSFGKVWIDGIGFMKDGRRWNDGTARFDERRLAAARR